MSHIDSFYPHKHSLSFACQAWITTKKLKNILKTDSLQKFIN